MKNIPRKTKTSISKSVSLLINEEPDFAIKDLMWSDYEHVPPEHLPLKSSKERLIYVPRESRK